MKSLFQISIPSFADPFAIPQTYIYLFSHITETNVWYGVLHTVCCVHARFIIE